MVLFILLVAHSMTKNPASSSLRQGKKDGSRSTLTFLAADRLLVTLEGENTSADLLKKAAGNLNFK